MKFPAVVHAEVDSSFDGKRGHKEQRSLILADMTEGAECLQFFEYPLQGDETKLSGTLLHQRIECIALEFRNVFGGRPQISRGQILVSKNGK